MGQMRQPSDRDTRLQLVLRSRVWFRLGVSDKWECPQRLWRKGLLALSKASEAINGNDSWVGGPGSHQPQRQGPLESRSPEDTLGPVLWMSEVSEEAIRIVITMNTYGAPTVYMAPCQIPYVDHLVSFPQ